MKKAMRFYGIGGSKIDPAARRIEGFAVARKGPAAGHGEYLDDESLDQIVKLGNAGNPMTGAVRSRLDHPVFGIEQTLCKMLGNPMNFRRDGDVVRADIQLLSREAAPEGDRLLALAAEAPQLIGSSLVFDAVPQQGKNPPVRFVNIYALDFVDLPATNPSGLFGAGDRSEEVGTMTKVAAYVKNGATFCTIEGKEYEIDLPSESKAQQKAAAEEGEGGGEAEEGKHAAKPTRLEAAKIRREAVEEERKYAGEFSAALTSSGLKAEAADDFRKKFYGRPIEDVKFLAASHIGAHAKAIGEGAGAVQKTEAEKTVDDEKQLVETATKRFAAEVTVRRMWTLQSDANHPDYKAGLERYIAAEKKWAADQKKK